MSNLEELLAIKMHSTIEHSSPGDFHAKVIRHQLHVPRDIFELLQKLIEVLQWTQKQLNEAHSKFDSRLFAYGVTLFALYEFGPPPIPGE